MTNYSTLTILVRWRESFLDLHLEFDSSGKLSTKIYDKRDDFDFKIINFPYLCSNIPTSPAYGVYIYKLIRYARACSNYSDFLERHKHLRTRLLSQEYDEMRLKVLLQNSFSNTSTKIWLKIFSIFYYHHWRLFFVTFLGVLFLLYQFWLQHIYVDYHHW